MVRGREFLESDQTGSVSVVVVNEAFAALAWPGLEALGQLLDVPDRELSMEVVGVVADTPPLEPGRAVAPEMYWPNRQRGRWGTFFVLRSEGDPGAVGAAASEALMALDPDLTLGSPRTLASSEARALLRPRFQAVVLLVFALAALALSAVGVYAVVSYAVQRRIREMGIRVALGADSADVMALVMRSSLGVSLLGLGLGLVGAVGTGRLLRGVVHGVSPTDPVSLGGSLLLLLVAAAVAAFVPARRATRADPLVAIRAD